MSTWIICKKPKETFLFKRLSLLNLSGLLLEETLALLLLSCTTAACASPKPVMVHYMPWFQTPYSLGGTSWGYHWTMNYFNPNTLTNGNREIGSWYYPLIGPYDSIDPAVLEYHVMLMKLAGIDGVIVDWYGQDNYYDYAINDARTLALLNYIQKAGLKFSLCYEDQTIKQEIAGGPRNGINVTSNNAVAHAQQTMLYAQTNYFASPNYLRWNGQPVLLNFGPQYFMQSTQWTAIFSVLSPSNQPAFFTLYNRLSPVATGAFNWFPSMTTNTPPSQVQSYLNSFEQSAASWPAFISTAFPRFHDIYAQAGGTSDGYLDDANGSTLSNTLARALTNSSGLVQIATWNDYGEGTIIEPTASGVSGCALVDSHQPTTVYGYTDLGIIQDCRRTYLDASFPYHTYDLALALRLFNLRKQYGNNAILAAEMDRIFANVVTGQLTAAGMQLSGLESIMPVIYNFAYDGASSLQFAIGGYIASNVTVQVSTNLTDWQTVQTFAASTNFPVFSTNTFQAPCGFFRLQY